MKLEAQKAKRRQIVKVLLFYVATFVAMAVLMWVVFENFGYSDENFIVVTLMLLPLSVLSGYLLSKVALEPLFTTNDLLDRLLKDTLHELNIPLATILANVSMLKRDKRETKALQRLDRIEKAARNLGELYEDLDYFIKKEIGHVEKESFDLSEAVRESIAKMEDIKGDISIQYHGNSVRVIADRRGFQKAIDNLLGNAIKYNKPSGWVSIELTTQRLIVRDGGMGMDEETLFTIFDRYFQNDMSASGYGIGLHIVKTFCDEHGIGIKIDSKKGEGSTFTLNLTSVLSQRERG